MFVNDKYVNENPWDITPFFTIHSHEEETPDTMPAYEETLE